jgi:transposase
MRGEDRRQQGVFSYVSLEERVPAEHPLRPVRKIVDEIFGGMSKQFDELYSATGRPSIAPERLL